MPRTRVYTHKADDDEEVDEDSSSEPESEGDEAPGLDLAAPEDGAAGGPVSAAGAYIGAYGTTAGGAEEPAASGRQAEAQQKLRIAIQGMKDEVCKVRHRRRHTQHA